MSAHTVARPRAAAPRGSLRSGLVLALIVTCQLAFAALTLLLVVFAVRPPHPKEADTP